MVRADDYVVASMCHDSLNVGGLNVGDLVKTPKVSTRDAEYAMKAGLGLGYYDWEGKLGVVVGFETICERTDASGNPFVKILMQNTGKLCIFSPSVLAKVE